MSVYVAPPRRGPSSSAVGISHWYTMAYVHRAPLQIVELRLQHTDSRLQIADSEFRNLDSELRNVDSKLSVSTHSFKTSIRSFKTSIPSFETSIRTCKTSIQSFEQSIRSFAMMSKWRIATATTRPQRPSGPLAAHSNPSTEDSMMARFPSREADVAALAGSVIVGLTESADDFPAPPVPAADLKIALDGYLASRDKASVADGAAAEAHGEKDEAFEELADSLRANLRYAEEAVKHDGEKLRQLGWGARKAPRALEAPGQVRTLDAVREGPGWVYLDWKAPSDGGAVAAYRVESRKQMGGEWQLVSMTIDSQVVLPDQERGVDLDFQVIAVNRAGKGEPSNVVSAML